MKNSKPLVRMATAQCSAVVSNSKPAQRPGYSTVPLLASRGSTHSATSESITTMVAPRIINNNFNGIQRTFATMHAASSRKPIFPLGTLALIGGVMLFLGTSTAEAFSFPFSSGKRSPAVRMKERLDKHGFIERVVVPDGNCQMRALADQIHGDENHHVDVRSRIMSWLSKNEKYQVDDNGSATLGDFIDRDTYPRWTSYVSYMSRNGSWGDHLTLVAASEVYDATIAIISNVEDNGTGQYITQILPRTKKPSRTLNLSHWHEMHYNSLHPANKVGAREL